MPFSFFTALSGLHANSDALGVTGNNIANANTVAFKRSQISFSDLFINSVGVRLNGAGNALQIGNGVSASSTTEHTQGNLTASGSPTSAAINGQGFFVVQDTAGVQSYTRAGDFVIDHDGYLVTPGGQRVQGYGAQNGTIPGDAPLSSIQLPLGATMDPVESTEATLRINLNADDADATVFHTPITVYDSRGTAHTLDLTFTKQPDGSYMLDATIGGQPAQLDVDGGGPAAGPIPVTFDGNGQLATPATSLGIVADPAVLNGATLANVDIKLRETNPDGSPGRSNITNYAFSSGVSFASQDGFPAGTISSLSIAPDGSGIVYAVADSGQLRPIAQIALASFASPEGLRHTGGNLFGVTAGSGDPSIGAALSGGRGGIVGGAVESSNVDITNEFIDLIVSQRGFQANSRVVTTLNQVLQDLIQSV